MCLCAVCDMVAQVQMLYMLLSLCMGWTLCRSRKSLSKPLQWDSSPVTTALALGGVVVQVSHVHSIIQRPLPWSLNPSHSFVGSMMSCSIIDQ